MPMKPTEPLKLNALHRFTLPAGTVIIHHLPNGTVTATLHGMTGAGQNEDEALWDLSEKLRSDSPNE
jgi:hypothetical protein